VFAGTLKNLKRFWEAIQQFIMPTAAITMQQPSSAGPVIPAGILQQEQQQQQQQPSPSQLRRAVYVHVSDLTSSYNIDNALLEEQLAKVKAMREERQKSKTSAAGVLHNSTNNNNNATTTTATTTTTAVVIGSADSAGGDTGGGSSNLTTSASGSGATLSRGGVPTELVDTSQKRLQPPRGGYNLCV
jgi:hypothetical protein